MVFNFIFIASHPACSNTEKRTVPGAGPCPSFLFSAPLSYYYKPKEAFRLLL
ncbi:hypothetical protein RUMGNA_02783 [Mediterraneibacter gnavus ATCC 29149]|uniref:Uncharacterized protein n=1 Tax=Mediterraneibacter gnavus (strain ATCC 29149 / DSM 114966 / JCM 6515 / VPI C7-9) TaxID=411470 RepID=A7B5E4_MEDG7|nr:hypothetical protein RUMGNA_02783 [Mediterraneibacter gnavus ATCC 29149]